MEFIVSLNFAFLVASIHAPAARLDIAEVVLHVIVRGVERPHYHGRPRIPAIIKSHERIIGNGDFVETVLAEAAGNISRRIDMTPKEWASIVYLGLP